MKKQEVLINRSICCLNIIYDDMLRNKIKAIASLIEPMMMLILGIIIGFVIWSIVSSMLAGYAQ